MIGAVLLLTTSLVGGVQASAKPRTIDSFDTLTKMIDAKSNPAHVRIESEIRDWKFGAVRVSSIEASEKIQKQFQSYLRTKSNSDYFRLLCQVAYFSHVAGSAVPSYSDFVFGKPSLESKEFARIAILCSARNTFRKGARPALDRLAVRYPKDVDVVGAFVWSNGSLTPFGERHKRGHGYIDNLLNISKTNLDYVYRAAVVAYGNSWMLSGIGEYKMTAKTMCDKILAMPNVEDRVRANILNFRDNILARYDPKTKKMRPK